MDSSRVRQLSGQTLLNVRHAVYLIALLLSLSLVSSYARAQQQPNLTGKRLSKIEVAGLERAGQEEAVAASGLKIGQAVSLDDLDKAAEQLLATGLFSDLSYNLRTTGDQVAVVFKVVEVKKSIPVVFDNFVWFTDEELASGVRRQWPSFDGKAPESRGAIESITKALERLLLERNVAGQVEYTPSDEPGVGAEHIFSVKGVNIPVCALHFAGASAITEAELLKNSKPLFENPYSRKFAGNFVVSNLGPLYRERGHLRIKFRDSLAKLEGGDKCKDGVDLTVPVEEGLAYTWDKAEWSGNEMLTPQELDAALGMKSGELANGLKLDKGMEGVSRAYGRKGYLTARLRREPAFDDANQRVLYRFSVNEGAQFRMGLLNITGLPESDAKQLRKKWALAPGDVYDASYLEEFMKKGVGNFVRDIVASGRVQRPPTNITSNLKLNRERQTVDVSITFK